MKTANKMIKAIELLQTTVGTRDVPLTWITLLLVLAEAGDRGVSTGEVMQRVGIAQGIVSRTVKKLSTEWDAKKGTLVGPGLLFITPDPLNRHQHAYVLTAKGWELMKELDKVLS